MNKFKNDFAYSIDLIDNINSNISNQTAATEETTANITELASESAGLYDMLKNIKV